jgi:hypothetical protein
MMMNELANVQLGSMERNVVGKMWRMIDKMTRIAIQYVLRIQYQGPYNHIDALQ